MTRPSTALGSMLVLVTLLIAWIVASAGDTSSRAAEPGRMERDVAPPARMLGELERPANSKRAPAVEQTRASAESPPSRPTLNAGRLVRVISDSSGEPLPGAVVTWIDLTSDCIQPELGLVGVKDILELCLESGSPEVELLKRGETWVADGEGLVFLPPIDGLVMGRHGDLWSMCEIREDPERIFVLALEADSTVILRVLDAQGVPVGGMEVNFCERAGVWPRVMTFGRTDDETGEATFPHLGAQVRAMRAGLFGDLDSSSDLFLSAVVQNPEPVMFSLDAQDMPVGRVDLILPPTGAVDLRIVDTEGELVRGVPYWVRLNEAEVDEYRFPGNYVNKRIGGKSVEEDGTFRFEHVGLGMEFSMELVLSGGGSFPQTKFLGPRSAGERVLLTIDPGPAPPSVTMRLLKEGGVPLEEGSYLEVTLNSQRGGETSELSSLVSTRGNGRIRLYGVGGEPFEVGDSCEFSVVHHKVPSMFVAHAWTAGPLRSGVNDLGNLTLAPAPVIASGTVIDASGAPIEGVNVSAGWYTPESKGRGRVPGANTSRRGSETDSAGAYSLQGLPDGDQISLVCVKRGFVESRVDGVDLGTKDVVIQLDRAGDIAGSVLVPEGVSPERIVLVVRASEVQKEEDDPHGRSLGSDCSPDVSGAFRSVPLTPGEYTVVVFFSDVAAPLMEVAGLRVIAGETTLDPRLDSMDLRSLHVIEVEITDRDGKPIPEGYLGVREAGRTDLRFDSNRFTDGHFSVVVPYAVVDLKVDALFHGNLDVSDVVADTHIVLDPWMTVRLALDDSSASLEDSPVIELWLESPDGEGMYQSADFEYRIGEDGEDIWYLDRPGRWVLHPFITREAGDRVQLDSIEFEVSDVPDEQRIEFHLAPEALEMALAEYRSALESGQ